MGRPIPTLHEQQQALGRLRNLWDRLEVNGGLEENRGGGSIKVTLRVHGTPLDVEAVLRQIYEHDDWTSST